MKPSFLCLSLAGLLSLAATTFAGNGPAQPNIIFILADDYGVGEVSSYGADNYKTPNIDKLAREGARFTHAYTAPLCGPSRALILTGRHGFRTGASNQDATGLITPKGETMMPRVLKTSGYVTSAVGKWFQLPLEPAAFGFDDYLTFTGSGVYWNYQDLGKTYVVNGVKRTLRDQEYLPDIMHQHVLDFIVKHRDRPFYVYYSLSHVHSAFLPTPDSVLDSKDYYTDNVVYMDKLVGKLMTELDRLKLREKTLVVFFGDNGTGRVRGGRATIGGRRLSGEKGSMLEGGALVPMIVNWPGVTPAGKVSPDFVDASDFFPTFAELAGATLPTSIVLDGHSLAAQFRGEKNQGRDWAFIQLARMWWVRSAGWKLNQSGQLFDMSDAPFSERTVPAGTTDAAAIAARKHLQAVLDQLNPAGGIPDTGDQSGRHSWNVGRIRED